MTKKTSVYSTDQRHITINHLQIHDELRWHVKQTCETLSKIHDFTPPILLIHERTWDRISGDLQHLFIRVPPTGRTTPRFKTSSNTSGIKETTRGESMGKSREAIVEERFWNEWPCDKDLKKSTKTKKGRCTRIQCTRICTRIQSLRNVRPIIAQWKTGSSVDCQGVVKG